MSDDTPIAASAGTFVTHDGTRLAFHDLGSGPTVVLLHALTANSDVNWVQPGIAAAITGRGWRVVMLDARGHGSSDRPSDPSAYGWECAGRDVIALLDHLVIDRCAVVGYSLGAGTAAWLTPVDPRVRGAILAGLDLPSIRPWSAEMVDAYVAALVTTGSGDSIEDDGAIGAFGSRVAVSVDTVRALGEPSDFRLDRIDVPVLVLNGTDDAAPEDLAREIRGAVTRRVPGDHGTTPLHPEFAVAILDFLDGLERNSLSKKLSIGLVRVEK